MKLYAALFSALFLGILLYFGAVLGVFVQSIWVSLLLTFGIFFYHLFAKKNQQYKKNTFTFLEKTLLFLLGLSSLSHSLQVFAPETGFDALWYHLPVAVGVIQHNGLYYAPELYQSVNPPFSDLFFTAGYYLGGEVGAKTVAYFFYVFFLVMFYVVCTHFLSRTKALALTLLISLFQVVSWQAASFYIDVTKAFWELSLLWVLLTSEPRIQKYKYYLLGLLLGASMATKQFSLLLIPLVLFLVWVQTKSLKKCLDLALFAVALALPYFVFTYLHTGSLFFSIQLHMEKLQEIGGTASPLQFLVTKVITIWKLPMTLAVARDYVFPPQAFLFIWAVLTFWKTKEKDTALLLLGFFSAYYYLLWWFIPPLSTRYVIAGLATSLVFIVAVLEKKLHNHTKLIKHLFFLVILGMFLPRLYVNARSLPFLVGFQSKKEYLDQFLDGNINTVLMKWHTDVYQLPSKNE